VEDGRQKIKAEARQRRWKGGGWIVKDGGGGGDFLIPTLTWYITRVFLPYAEIIIPNNLAVTSLHISCFLIPGLYGTWTIVDTVLCLTYYYILMSDHKVPIVTP
jgi:hypothetical protein